MGSMKAQLPPKIGIHSQNYCSTLKKTRVALEMEPTLSLGTTMVQAVKFYFLSLLYKRSQNHTGCTDLEKEEILEL